MNDTPLTRTGSAGDHFLEAIRGERDDLKWLDEQRPGLALFVRALDGGPKAREKLHTLTSQQWEDLFAVISDEEVYRELARELADVAALIDAVRGDDGVLGHLHRQKPSFAEIATLIREANEKAVAPGDGDGQLDGTAASDVGCLIGELHLERGEYHKAVEAFTRAIENQPCPDVYLGRARAYQALAAMDEEQALALRPRVL